MHHLNRISLFIPEVDNTLNFYQNKLGMELVHFEVIDGIQFYRLSFDASANRKESLLELVYDENRALQHISNPSTLNGYWKIAICIKDVDIARRQLTSRGVNVQEARQVPNVAYLCHLYDPNGFCIELIQHQFEANHTVSEEDNRYLLGNRPVLSLVTYRVRSTERSLAFYTQKLGMTLLSKMNVSQYGFDLYFLGYDTASGQGIESVAIREQLWQKPITMVELQHIYQNDKPDFSYKVDEETGFAGITIQSDRNDSLTDPDGYPIQLAVTD